MKAAAVAVAAADFGDDDEILENLCTNLAAKTSYNLLHFGRTV